MKNKGEITYCKLKSGGYRLLDEWWVESGVSGSAARLLYKASPMIELTHAGRLTVYPQYQWDGASGPVIDRKANMRAGLAHDALYQLCRAGHLGLDKRAECDRVYRELVIECGGWKPIAWIDYAGLRLFAGYAASPQPEEETKRLAA